jgi:hypothetical protein
VSPQHHVVEPLDQPPVGFAEGGGVEFLPVLAQLDGISKQVDERLNNRPHRLPIELLAQHGQLAEQVDQAALPGAIQAVVRRVEVADQGADKRFSQHPDEDIAAAMAVNQEQRQLGDDHKGDWWDHVAYDPEHKLVLAVIPGARR